MQAGEGECNGLILCRYRFRAALRKVFPNAALCCSVLLSDLMPGKCPFRTGDSNENGCKGNGQGEQHDLHITQGNGQGMGKIKQVDYLQLMYGQQGAYNVQELVDTAVHGNAQGSQQDHGRDYHGCIGIPGKGGNQ